MSGVKASEIEKLFESILEVAVKPVVLELSEESGQSIDLKAVAVPQGLAVERIQRFTTSEGSDGVAASGEARVILKGSGYPSGFMVEAIFEGLCRGTGFSGFSMRGKAKLEDESPSVKVTARTNRYNVREWSREFRGA